MLNPFSAAAVLSLVSPDEFLALSDDTRVEMFSSLLGEGRIVSPAIGSVNRFFPKPMLTFLRLSHPRLSCDSTAFSPLDAPNFNPANPTRRPLHSHRPLLPPATALSILPDSDECRATTEDSLDTRIRTSRWETEGTSLIDTDDTTLFRPLTSSRRWRCETMDLVVGVGVIRLSSSTTGGAEGEESKSRSGMFTIEEREKEEIFALNLVL